jgi:hypothetical protein
VNTSTPAAFAARMTRSGFSTTPAGRWTSVAGAVYIAAWISGLLLVSSAPASTGPAGDLHDFYVWHGPAIVVQALLVHGLAGIALAVLAATLPVAAGAAPGRRLAVRLWGWSAAAVSFVQVALTVVAVLGAGVAAAETTRTLVHAVDIADAVKLVLLAGFVTTATRLAARAELAPVWVRALARALVVLLPLGGASFVVPNGLLGLLLIVSLPVLLVWAGAVAYLVGRHARG